MFKTLDKFNVTDKRVLVRCDFNVPLDKEGNISDDFKIKETLPTIRYLIQHDAKVILMSHLDPENTGFVDPQFTLENVAKKLSEYLFMNIEKTNDCIGQETLEKVNALQSGHVLLLENLRFHKGEVDNTPEFAKKLAELGDIFINDAFAECHRSYASIIGIPTLLPSGAGLLLEREINNLTGVLENPERPFLAIVGGGKATTKVKFLERISKLADEVIVSGPVQHEIIKENIQLDDAQKITAPSGDLEALDILAKDIKVFKEKILKAKTILWNGPFGQVEDEKYKKGTLEIAKAIIKSKAFSIVGGGSTIEFLDKERMISKFGHVSTGGGAMLEFFSGEPLPGIKALES